VELLGLEVDEIAESTESWHWFGVSGLLRIVGGMLIVEVEWF
jgi:hypothetical protein